MIVLPKSAVCGYNDGEYLTSSTRIMVVTTALIFALQMNAGLAQIPLATPQSLTYPATNLLYL